MSDLSWRRCSWPSYPNSAPSTAARWASLAGVAPHPKDSGKANWHRSTTGGRRQIRPALFIAALAACRGDNPLAVAYKALLKAAKPKRVALTAIMRKIITIANARVRDAVRHQNEIGKINA
uniref:transposase n=1 Tax=Rhizobium laguerreae TaxID=1076926 RepID=UPI0028B12197|nr:transposase [Rhizobium laguerreae]